MWLVCHVQSKIMSNAERFLYQPLSIVSKPVDKKAVEEEEEEVKNGSLSDEDEESDDYENH